MTLAIYKKKRDFKKTKEPKARLGTKKGNHFVVQKHNASHLHYDFRLELDGVLKSWAVPKGPSLSTSTKRLAVQVEDHPVDYASFEGEIPEGEYGGGQVIVWDQGDWKSVSKTPAADLKKGRLEFELTGTKLKGKWILVRTRGQESRSWLLMKRSDAYSAKAGQAEIVDLAPDSVLTDRSVEELRGTLLAQTKKAVAPKAKASPRANGKKAVSINKNSALRKLPGFIKPELATLQDQPPIGPEWVHEIKFDGYRTQCRIQGVKVQFLTRSGLDWTQKYRDLKKAFQNLGTENAIIDGEIVCVDEKGRSRFELLQQALKAGQSDKLLFYAFDLLFLDGEDLRELPLNERKLKLQTLVSRSKSDKLVFSEHWQTSGKQMLGESCKLDLEGIISKKLQSTYQEGRGDDWIKSKCGHEQEFVIAGYTKPKGSRSSFGALLLAAYDQNDILKYVGRVGTGFDDKRLKGLLAQMKPMLATDSPFEEKVPEESQIIWLKPELVAQIRFAGFTGDGMIRHGSFLGLREDKPAQEVHEEVARKAGKKSVSKKTTKVLKKSISTAKKISGQNKHEAQKVHLTHPDRVIFSEGRKKVLKQDLADFYDRASDRMLAYLADRPLSLLRCPDGADKKCFFQKHVTPAEDSQIRVFDAVRSEGKSSQESALSIDSATGLVSLVQMGVVEIHNWGCHREAVERPDVLVFDLDPDTKVSWAQMIDGALAIRQMLEKLKLKSFLKVTGGKGLHIHVPVEPIYTWDQAKLFARTLSAHLVQNNPELYTIQLLKKERTGKIFLDYLRNGYGSTAVAPYSVRARHGAPVALPIPWKALTKDLQPDQFRLLDGGDLLKKFKTDPWSDMKDCRQKISVLEDHQSEKSKKGKVKGEGQAKGRKKV